jgi:hypothetical protein
MFKVRLAVLGALALFVVSGFSASAASASGPYWHVGGAKLKGTRQIKLQSKGPLFLKSTSLAIECKNSISEGSTIEGGEVIQGQAKGRVLYSSCKVTVPAEEKCKIQGGQIKTHQIKSYLANAATQTGVVEVFVPTETNVFTEFVLENGPGGSCPFKPEEPVGAIGSAVAEVIPAGVEGQEGMLAFPSTAILKVKHEGQEVSLPSLKTAGFVSTFSGIYAARLATFPETFGVFET